MHDSRRTRVVLGILLVAALALVTFDYRGGASPVRGAGASVFGTAENVASAVTSPFARLFHGITGGSSQDQVAALQRQVVRLQAQLDQARLSKTEAAQLQQLLQLAGRGRYRVVAATVIASGPAYQETVTIDAGAADGIKPNMTVLNGAGLVGTTTSVSAHTATVLLATDAAATVGVRLAGTGQIGAVTGAGRTRSGPALLRLQVFNASAVLRPGEQIVTFGSVGGRPYVPGVPVGVITKVTGTENSLTKLALVRPYADDSALGVVGVVIVPPRKNPRDSVLPPSPQSTLTPAPTPAASGSATPAQRASATATGG